MNWQDKVNLIRPEGRPQEYVQTYAPKELLNEMFDEDRKLKEEE